MQRAHHLNLIVGDMEVSRDFYVKYADFREMDHHENMTVMQDDTGMDLVLEPGNPTPAGFHFGFRLNTNAAYEEKKGYLEESGIEILHEEDINGMLTFKFRDPDGYLVEFYTYGW